MFLLWSHVFSMCSLQISVLFVLMTVEISLFSSGMLGSCGVFLLAQFLCVILLRKACGRSLSVLRILPTGMFFLCLTPNSHSSPLCPLCNTATSSHQLYPHTHHVFTSGFMDRPHRSDGTSGQMDGEGGWWTTSGKIELHTH